MTEAGLIARLSDGKTCRHCLPQLSPSLPGLALPATADASRPDCFQAMLNPTLDPGSLPSADDFDVEQIYVKLFGNDLTKAAALRL